MFYHEITCMSAMCIYLLTEVALDDHYGAKVV